MADSVRASVEGLKRVDLARRRKGWTKTCTSRWWEAALVSQITLKRFWQPEKHRIDRDNFASICKVVGIDDWESLLQLEVELDSSAGSFSLGIQDWGEAPEMSPFYGRETELKQLQHWIQNSRCKVVGLFGMGGMGKTSLAVWLADQIENEFEFLFWRSLANAPRIESILNQLIPFLSAQQITQLPEQITEQITLVIQCLQNHRCLVVLDNLESILEDGESRGYGELLRRIGSERHQSCLLWTSRVLPREIDALEGDKIQTLQLSGLKDQDGQKIFWDRGSFTATDQDWQTIVNHYGGNPLALKLVASTLFSVGRTIHDFVEQRLDFPVATITNVLKEQVDHLSDPALEVLFWLAIYRKSASFEELAEDLLTTKAKRGLHEALRELNQCSLIQLSAAHQGYTLQPVVMEFITNTLIEQVLVEFLSQRNQCLRTHALIQTNTRDYIREAQLHFILDPLAEKLIEELGSPQQIQIFCNQFLDLLRGQPPVRVGYTAGNLINLMVRLQVDLRQSNFSYLYLRQAYLRGILLHQVNFAGSEFSRCVFTEIFSGVLSLAFSPNGSQLAISDNHAHIVLWQWATGERQMTLREDLEWIFSVAYHPSGRWLASGSLDWTVRLWDLQTGSSQAWRKHTNGIAKVLFSPDGSVLASCSADGTVILWEFITGETLCTLTGHRGIVWSLVFSPDGSTLVSADLNGTILLWDLRQRKDGVSLNQTIHTGLPVHSLVFNCNGTLLMSADGKGEIKVWDPVTGNLLQTLVGHTQSLWSLAYTPNGDVLASAGDDYIIKLWDLKSGQCLKTLLGYQDRIWSLAFSPDGRFLAGSSQDRTVRIWEVATGECWSTLLGYTIRTEPVGFSPDSTQVYTFNTDDQKLRYWNWDSETGKGLCTRIQTLQGSGILQTVQSPKCELLAAGGLDQKVWIGDPLSGIYRILEGHSAWVRYVQFSPDSQRLASASGDATARLWNVSTGQCLQIFRGHTLPLQCLAFNPQGTLLATGSWDRSIKLWDVETGVCLRTWDPAHGNRIESLVFSPQGNRLFSTSLDLTLKVWDINTGQCLRAMTEDGSGLFAMSLSPDGVTLAVISYPNGPIIFWDVNTWEQQRVSLPGSNGYCDIAFSPNGEILAVGFMDGACRLWGVKEKRLLATLQVPRPYEGMNILEATGLSPATLSTLVSLGATPLS